MSTLPTANILIDRLTVFSTKTKVALVRQGLADERFEDPLDHATDIDFWTTHTDRQQVNDFITKQLDGYLISRCDASHWLNHDIYLIPCLEGLLLTDISVGDFMVGPLLLVPQAKVSYSSGRLRGAAAVADLVLRPLLRGRRPSKERIQLARDQWPTEPPDQPDDVERVLKESLPGEFVNQLRQTLHSTGDVSHLGKTIGAISRKRVFSSPPAFVTALRKALLNVVSKLTGRNRPFGRYSRGVLLTLSGTDGSGKTSAISPLLESLSSQNVRCRIHYLGRGRGNLPGTDHLRNIIGKAVVGNTPASGVDDGHSTSNKPLKSRSSVYRYTLLNKAVSWFYAIEYFIRTIKPWIQARALGYVVLCDRYVYDVELIPNHSVLAMKFARLVCPVPDINVWLHATPDVILERKQERDVKTIEKHQAVYQQLIHRQLARRWSLEFDTGNCTVHHIVRSILPCIHRAMHHDYH